MGVLLPRRFLNLIVSGRSSGVKLLRRIDLTTGHQLFYGAGSEKPAAAGGLTSMETIRFADPSFTFRSLNKEWKMHCFPVADYSECKLICADQSGRSFVFDMDSSKVGTMPALPGKPWLTQPISVFVHRPQVDGNMRIDSNGSSLFLMEKFPQPEARRVYERVQEKEESVQFVGFIKRHPDIRGGGKTWHYRLLPPPPFVLETRAYSNGTPEITAYGVVGGGGGSHVCISVDGVGTYCLDMESLTWSQVGEWSLPFRGKVEYVPALKLWFGLSADAAGGRQQHLAAADLSGMLLGSSSSSSSQPQWRLVGGPWEELVHHHLPEERKECKDPQFVSLNSGRFCIARFFSQEAEAGSGDGEVVHKNCFTVLTGVEVNNSGKGEGGTGKLELQMIPHKSGRVDNSSIETLF